MTNFIIAGSFGGWEILVIVAVLLLFFGGKKIPELMRGLGKGVGEFKKGMKDGDVEDNAKEPSKEQKD